MSRLRRSGKAIRIVRSEAETVSTSVVVAREQWLVGDVA